MVAKKSETKEQAKTLSRRELIGKYGAYTAPVVVSMLVPSQSYAENGATPYSSLATCLANHMLNMMGNPKVNHCNNMHPIP